MSYHTELAPQNPPSGWSPANPLIGTESPQGQWVWNGGGWELNSDFVYESTPIVEVNLQATTNDNFFFQSNPDEQYVGPYHRHEDGTLMIGDGIPDIEPKPESPPIGVSPANPLVGTLSPQGQWVWVGNSWEENSDFVYVHEMIPDEIIFRKIGYQDIQETREKVSDIFYKVWFESNTLSEEEILSMQTTIRDGIKQTGRNEDEPLVFYKKDRNTLESRKDLQGDAFEEICQYIFNNQIDDLDGRFSISVQEFDPTLPTTYYLRFRKLDSSFIGLIIAVKVEGEFIDVLNLSQLTKPKFGSRIDAEKAREVLDTNIFELLPNQTTRQDEINDFFTEFDNLIGPTPVFQDVDGDGVGEDIQNKEQDEQSRISFENQPNAFITRLDEQAEGSSINQGKTLESMRNRLNTYLGDVDNVIQTLEDDRPDYQNISDGFLKIRKPNQAIIVRAPGNDLLEFQKINPDTGKPSYLEDGFTITMWVRFVSKTSEGTLFNFGNPLEENGSGFRLETRTSIDSSGNYRRWIRLVVKDDYVRDNHFGDINAKRRPVGLSKGPLDYYAERNFHKLYPNIPNDDLNEWYFICATYNPQVVEVVNLDDDNPLLTDKEYWLNHKIYYNTLDNTEDDFPFISVGNRNDIVANSLEGARCKVEIISRSDLLRARGFKVDDLTVDAPAVDGLEEDENISVGENGDGNGVGEGEGNNGIEPSVGDVDNIINPSSEQSSEEEIERSLEEREEEETSSPTITIRNSGGY